MASSSSNISYNPSNKPFILVASLPRSGTLSLKRGLETLGFGPTLHMSVFTRNRPLHDLWIPALRSPSTADWPYILKDFGSAVDEPQSSVTLNILRGYLAAERPIKVVLLKRDPEKWWISYRENVARYWHPGTLPYTAIKYIAASIPGAMMLYHCTFMELIDWNRYHRGYLEEYQADVRRFVQGLDDGSITISSQSGEPVKVPQTEFLEFSVTEGWEPLCQFLGVKMPDEPFPWINESGGLGKSYWIRIYKGTAFWILYIGLGWLGIDFLGNSHRYARIWAAIWRVFK